MKSILFIMFILLSLKSFGASHGVFSTVNVPQGGIILLPANKGRKAVIIQNINGAGNVAIKLDSIPANDDDGHNLGTREHIRFDVTNAIWAKSDQVTGDIVSITEIIE